MKKYYSLCFHRVSDEISPAYPPIPTAVFEQIIKYLSKRIGFLSPYDIIASNTRKKSGVLITFDDGFYDFYENALPILVKYDVPAILSIITKCASTGESFWTQKLNKIIEAFYKEKREKQIYEITSLRKVISLSEGAEKTALKLYLFLLNRKDRDIIIKRLIKILGKVNDHTKMMTWKEINECKKFNIVFGSHTHTHTNLTLLKPHTLKKEISTSYNDLKEQTGEAPEFIAFPNGQFNEAVLLESYNIGFKVGLTIGASAFLPNDNAKIIPTIPRYNIYNNNFIKNLLKLERLFLFR